MNVLNRKILPILLILLVVVCGGYTYLWFYTTEELEDWLVSSIERLEQEGCLISYDRIEIKGFPFKLEAWLLNPCIQLSQSVPLKISGPGFVTVTTSVWNPQQAKIKGNEKISCFLLGNDAEESPVASVDHFQIRGTLNKNFCKNSLITLKDLQIGTLKIEDFSFACVNDQTTHSAEKVFLNVNNMSFISATNKIPFPSTIQQISLEANVSMPTTFEGRIATILKSWYEQDGIIDLIKVNLVWGDIRLEGSGSLSLDQDLQPLGAFTVNIWGIEPILMIMTEQKMIHKSVVPIIKTALTALLGTEDKKQETYHSIPISLQDRELSIAAIPIIKFEPIKWSEINF